MTREEAIFRLRELADMLESDVASADATVFGLVAVTPHGLLEARYDGSQANILSFYAAIGAAHTIVDGFSEDLLHVFKPDGSRK